ncbi:MAG: N-acetylmuramoyl-L-alanine amidase [Candidatus Parcubacteria bacterium]|nr:N-acetylmuramoyl-L-alanine amidase [Candidatus Parcubacteria bacterium]
MLNEKQKKFHTISNKIILKILKYQVLIFCIIIFVFLVIPNIVLAVAAEKPNIKLQIPILGFTDAADIAVYIKAVYKAATYIVVPIVIVVIMLGGIEWLTAAGRDPEGMNNAKSRIWHGLIGLGIVLLSYVLLSLVGITELKPPSAEYITPEALETEEITNPPAYTQGSGGIPALGTGKKKALYVHWSAGSTSGVSPHYTFTVKGDGVVVQSFPPEQDPTYCTYGRNKNSICIAVAGASGFSPKCYPNGSILGEACTNGSGKLTEKQIAALRAKINALKSQWGIPAITHSQAAAADNYHCVQSMNKGPNTRGKCKWDFWKDANNYTF